FRGGDVRGSGVELGRSADQVRDPLAQREPLELAPAELANLALAVPHHHSIVRGNPGRHRLLSLSLHGFPYPRRAADSAAARSTPEELRHWFSESASSSAPRSAITRMSR